MIHATRILIPVSGNATDDEAVALAASIAKQCKARLYAIYVIEVKRTLPLDVDLPSESTRGEEVLARAEQVARTAGVSLEGEILQARDTGSAIVDEAVAREVDLIVLGIAFNHRFGDFDLGETVPYVLRNATCRVWVARAAAAPAPAPAATARQQSHGR